MKVCSKCGIEKELTEFYNSKNGKDGLQSRCKKCVNEINKNWSKLNSEKNKKIKERYRNKNIENLIESHREYNNKNIEKLIEYRKNNAEKISKTNKQYRKNNSEKLNKKKRKYLKQKRKNNTLFKLIENIRCLIGVSIRNQGFKKSSRTSAILGCSFEEFQLHIEKQFKEGMSWDNRELWHLDHIYPVSRAVDEQHLLQLNHYTNFQPLWAEDNIRKGNKLPAELLDNQPNNLL